MGKLEEVAEALWQAEWARAGNGGKRRVPWTEIAPVDQERWRFLARAAISAVREPDDAMVKAGWKGQPSGPCCDWDIAGVFTAMIDSALSEEQG